MSYRRSDEECGEENTVWANIVPVKLRAESRQAFRAWLDASDTWSTLNRAIEANGDSPTARRRLQESEQRLNAAAEAYARAQQRLSDSPSLCGAAWRGAGALSREGASLVPVPESQSAS